MRLVQLRRIPPLSPPERFFLAHLADDPPLPAGPGPAVNGRFWQTVLSLARFHHLGGLLYARRRQWPWWEDAPEFLRRSLRQLHVQTALRNTLYLQELGRVMDGLAASDIHPVVLKGAALLLTALPDPGQRPFADIDLLIGRDELDRAAAAMRELGYEVDETVRSEYFYRRHHFHLIFRHPESTWRCFELHWDLSLPIMDTNLQAEAIRRRARPLSFEGRTLLVPAPADFLLHLCQHAALNAFSILAQIRDVQALVSVNGPADLDPEGLWRRAAESRLRRATVGCLSLARLFGKSPLLEQLERTRPRLGADGWFWPLLRPELVLRRQLLVSVAGNRALAMQRRDRLSDRLAYIRRLLAGSYMDMSEEGVPEQRVPWQVPRRISRHGAKVMARTFLYLLLARLGWEVAPEARARPVAITRPEPNDG
jgi:hypothetical protein